MLAAPHDALFRRLFADAQIAASAVAAVLPAEILARLDLSSLKLAATAHVDEALRSFHSDVVFEARIAGRDALVLLLLEHQSTSDPMMAFRLLQYAVLLWDGYLRDNPGATRLPLIVPVVFHQGPGEWRAPRDLIELLDLTAEEAQVLGRYVPRMGFEVDDLGRTDDTALLARGMTPEATLALAALRDVRVAGDVTALVARWAELLRQARGTPSGARAFSTVLRYILEVHSGLDIDDLSRIAESVLAGTGAEVMATAQQLIEVGKAQGKAEGKAEGRRATLRHLLRLKFRDAATPQILASLDGASETELDELEERILTATTIEQLFG